MFEDQENLTAGDLQKKAAALSLDMDAFNSCLESGKYLREIGSDVNEAVKAGVVGTTSMAGLSREYDISRQDLGRWWKRALGGC